MGLEGPPIDRLRSSWMARHIFVAFIMNNLESEMNRGCHGGSRKPGFKGDEGGLVGTRSEVEAGTGGNVDSMIGVTRGAKTLVIICGF